LAGFSEVKGGFIVAPVPESKLVESEEIKKA
jgi:hypothetical protein